MLIDYLRRRTLSNFSLTERRLNFNHTIEIKTFQKLHIRHNTLLIIPNNMRNNI